MFSHKIMISSGVFAQTIMAWLFCSSDAIRSCLIPVGCWGGGGVRQDFPTDTTTHHSPWFWNSEESFPWLVRTPTIARQDRTSIRCVANPWLQLRTKVRRSFSLLNACYMVLKLVFPPLKDKNITHWQCQNAEVDHMCLVT